MMPSTFPTFSAFYRQINARDPFPWQARLANLVTDGDWPSEIGVPTGVGKTACIDIAVWALASHATRHAADRTAATRIWYVVNRRLLVDAAYDHGRRIAQLLRERPEGPAAAVADALRKIAGTGDGYDPLHVSRLRGGAEHGIRPPTLAQPALTFATVPMFASRWLFRGYGVSPLMRPIDAAGAGIDALVLLDEAHLARPLADLVEPARLCDPGDPECLLPPQRAVPQFVALTATGDRRDRFALDDTDRAHPVIQQRLSARKPVRLVEATRKTLSRTLAETALALLGEHAQPRACVVFVNTTRTAADVAALLDNASPGTDVVVLTGRLRSREAQRVRSRLLDPDAGVAAGTTPTRDRPLIVVSTQTLEVGADLDFDLLVSETAGARALVQRLGRLDRLGTRPHAAGSLVHPTDEPDRPVYGTEPESVWQRLVNAADDGVVELGPARAAGVLGEPADVPKRCGELLPAHLWEYAKTSLPPPGEAPPELFFSGIESDTARVSVCWRAWLPDEGLRAQPVPVQDESVDAPIGEVRTLIERLDTTSVRRLARDATVEKVDPADLRPGDVIMVDSSAGGYDPTLGYHPDAKGTVLDVSVVDRHVVAFKPAVLRHITTTLPAHEPATALASLHPAGLDTVVDNEARQNAKTAVVSLLSISAPREGVTADEWRTLIDNLTTSRLETMADGTVVALPRRSRRLSAQIASDTFDDLSFDATSEELFDHCGTVGELAGRLGAAVGLADELVTALEQAGLWHDLGKADIRFQRWLSPDGPAVLRAKSGGGTNIGRARDAAGWPRRGRHELLSGRLLQAHPSPGVDQAHRELVHHLVVSHHGYGRPSVPAVDDVLPTQVALTVNGNTVTCSGDLSVDDWSQPARFRALCETYGYWGLALLEGLLRQADHAASSAVEVL